MGTRVSYPVEIKMKAIKMRLVGVPVKQVMEELNIRNRTKLKTWMKWYRNGEHQRLEDWLFEKIVLHSIKLSWTIYGISTKYVASGEQPNEEIIRELLEEML